MAHSSWGSGWPNCQGSKIDRGFYVDTKWGRVTFPGGVRYEISELVARLVKETSNRGYRFGIVGNPSYGCWGYNCRAISGSSTPSNHSWGVAIDINAPKNPYAKTLITDMPGWMPDLWNAYGFRWGGDYVGAKDAMHYEFMGSIADAARYTGLARQNRLGESHIPTPLPPKPEEPRKVVDEMYFLVTGDVDRNQQWMIPLCGPKRKMRSEAERDWFFNQVKFFGGAVSIAGFDANNKPLPHVWSQADVDSIPETTGNVVDNTMRWYAAQGDSPVHEIVRQVVRDDLQETPDAG